MVNAEFNGCSFVGNGTAISAPHDSKIKAVDTQFIDNKIGVEIRDRIPKELIELFEPRVDTNKILNLMADVSKHKYTTQEQVTRRLKKTGLSKWIANGANTATVATAIIEAVKYLCS